MAGRQRHRGTRKELPKDTGQRPWDWKDFGAKMTAERPRWIKDAGVKDLDAVKTMISWKDDVDAKTAERTYRKDRWKESLKMDFKDAPQRRAKTGTSDARYVSARYALCALRRSPSWHAGAAPGRAGTRIFSDWPMRCGGASSRQPHALDLQDGGRAFQDCGRLISMRPMRLATGSSASGARSR